MMNTINLKKNKVDFYIWKTNFDIGGLHHFACKSYF